jgi:uncharacterized membrane protein HdeD (DUF308 family)
MNVDSIAPALKKASVWVIIWSAVVFICGILAMILPLTFAFGIAFVIGGALLIGGIAHFVFAFQTRGLGGFLWHMLLGALYGIGAISLLANSLWSVLSLAFFLAVLLFLEGVLELVLYFRVRRSSHSGWLLIDGVGTLVLGILMIGQWPPASPEVIGTLIGISLMLSAVSRALLSLAIRALGPAPA